jgi:hypothetical protein
MNLKNMTAAMIAALVYEVILKLTHVLTPSLHHISLMAGITTMLAYLTRAILVIFLYFFYQEEKDTDRMIRRLLIPVLACFALILVLRIPALRVMLAVTVTRVLGQSVGLVVSVLLLFVVLVYRKSVPGSQRRLRQAALFVSITFGIGVITSLARFVEITRFAASGEATEHSPAFFGVMLVVFLVTHVALIYFLYEYYRLKSRPARPTANAGH